MITKNKWFRIGMALVLLALLVGGGYALNRIGYGQGYVAGLEENVGEEGLSQLFAEHWGERDDWAERGFGDRFGETEHFSRRGFGVSPWRGRFFGPFALLMRLFFFGGFVLMIIFLTRAFFRRRMFANGMHPGHPMHAPPGMPQSAPPHPGAPSPPPATPPPAAEADEPEGE